MGPTSDDDRPDDSGLSSRDRRTLASLEREVARATSLRDLWALARLRFLARWGAQVRMAVGAAASVAGLVVMWAELSSSIWAAGVGEAVLTVGWLVLVDGAAVTWARRQARHSGPWPRA